MSYQGGFTPTNGPLRWARCPDDGRLHLLQPPRSLLPRPGTTPKRCAVVRFPWRVSFFTDGSAGAACMACVDGIPSPGSDLGPQGYPVSSPVPDPPLLSADAAASALQEYFLANADRGDNAANDELVAEMLRRIRARRASHEGSC